MVELRNITKHFGDFVAVDRIDLRIESGEFLTLLGPSGCGKTTLLRIISGFENPSEGMVLLDDCDVTAVPPYRRDVNQVFQSYALFPHLSVQENIAFGLRMKKTPRAERQRRVAEAVELVSLSGLESRKPHQLSGGQKQRVALARALVCRPRVLLLDEPLAALDAKLRRAMQIELKRLQARVGITFVFVTHDQEEALVMSDRVAVMNQGHIEQLGGASEIYHHPATRFVADFLGQANVLEVTSITTQDGRKEVLIANAIRLCLADQVGCKTEAIQYVVVRPERIRLSLQQPPPPNVFPVTLREQIFRGPMRQLLVETESGRPLNVLSTDVGFEFQAGGQVYASVDAGDIVPIPPDHQNGPTQFPK